MAAISAWTQEECERFQKELDDNSRAMRIRELAAQCVAAFSVQNGMLEDGQLRLACQVSLENCARIIDTLDALPVPEREKP